MPITNLSKAIKETQQEFFKIMQGKQKEYQDIATKNAKEAVLALRVYDTGYLYRHTSCLVRVTLTFIEFSFRTVDTPYAKYPYYGFGTSRKYGPRKYLELGANNTLKNK